MNQHFTEDDLYGAALANMPFTDDATVIESYMAERIPSHVYIARAVPVPGGKFQALYSAPGLETAIAKTKDGRPYEYSSEVEAEAGAVRALHGVLNAPRIKARASQGKSERYRKLTGPEFAVLLRQAGVTATWFAYVMGTSVERVLKWVDGVDDVPHPARLLLMLILADERNAGIIEKVTDENTTTRRPERAE